VLKFLQVGGIKGVRSDITKGPAVATRDSSRVRRNCRGIGFMVELGN
jgi:hypothetical protein